MILKKLKFIFINHYFFNDIKKIEKKDDLNKL